MKVKIYYQKLVTPHLVGYQKRFRLISKETLTTLGYEGDYEISVTICDDETIHEYNKQYRGIDRPTDVLSFAFEEDGGEEVPILEDQNLPHQLGDIVISYPTALRQARSYHHSLEREMCFLFLHGLLHLLGYDHQNEAQESTMFTLQDSILHQLQIDR